MIWENPPMPAAFRCFIDVPLELAEYVLSVRTTVEALVLESDQGRSCHEDHVEAELVALARAGDEAGFRELAGCVMPAGEVDECWEGTLRRLRRKPCPVSHDPNRIRGRAFLDLLEDPQDDDPLVSI